MRYPEIVQSHMDGINARQREIKKTVKLTDKQSEMVHQDIDRMQRDLRQESTALEDVIQCIIV